MEERQEGRVREGEVRVSAGTNNGKKSGDITVIGRCQRCEVYGDVDAVWCSRCRRASRPSGRPLELSGKGSPQRRG
jgi:hypothetical protein